MVCIQGGTIEADISDKKKYRLEQVETFKYVGSMISTNDGGEEVRCRVGVGWDNGENCPK